MVRAFRKILLDLAPDEAAVEQHIGAVVRMHERAAGGEGRLPVEHEWQPLVVDAHQFRRVLRERTAVGHDGRHPLAGVARHIDGERPALHVRRIEAGDQRLGRRGKLAPIDDGVYAGHAQRLGFVDRDDTRGGIRARHERDVTRPRHGNIRGEPALPRHKTPVLAHPAVGRYEAERLYRRGHGSVVGWFEPRIRSAASAIASTIWA